MIKLNQMSMLKIRKLLFTQHLIYPVSHIWETSPLRNQKK